MEKIRSTIIIEDWEDKLTSTNVPYTRFKSPVGWMSCFDSDVCKKLKEFKGKTAEVMIQTNEKGFTNIVGFISGTTGSTLGPQIPKPMGPMESAVRKATPSNHTTMYVSYAKDLCISLGTQGKATTMIEWESCMRVAIDRIKQAKRAFEEI